MGGVGSWTAEALARVGVGALTLVDLDHVCVTNVNRQVLALDSSVGAPKADVMAARVADINPECVVRVVPRLHQVGETAATAIRGLRGGEDGGARGASKARDVVDSSTAPSTASSRVGVRLWDGSPRSSPAAPAA